MIDHYPVRHIELKGDLDDGSMHTLDTVYARRISDELVVHTDTKEGNGKRYGEVVGIVTPDKTYAEGREHDDLGNNNSLYIVRYPDFRNQKRHIVGLATRVNGELKQGIILEPDKPVYFGRIGDMTEGGVGFMDNKTVLGLAALSGVEDKKFGNGVSRIHGSFMLMPDGRVTIADGYELVDQNTRAITDMGSLNATRVTSAHESVDYQENIISAKEKQDTAAEHEAHLAKLFMSPQESVEAKPRTDAMTPQSITDAVQTLIASKDNKLKQIIGQHMVPTAEGATYVDARERVFSNSALRTELGKYLLEKARNDKGFVLDEINKGEEKPPNHRGYSKMRSDEYVVLLAMSMLDGTFITETSQADPVQLVDRLNSTVFENGRHRVAALRLLDLESGKGAPEHLKWARRRSS